MCAMKWMQIAWHCVTMVLLKLHWTRQPWQRQKDDLWIRIDIYAETTFFRGSFMSLLKVLLPGESSLPRSGITILRGIIKSGQCFASMRLVLAQSSELQSLSTLTWECSSLCSSEADLSPNMRCIRTSHLHQHTWISFKSVRPLM